MNPVGLLVAGFCFLTAYLLGEEKPHEGAQNLRDDADAGSGSESARQQRSVHSEDHGSGRVGRAKDVTPNRRRTRHETVQSSDAVAARHGSTDDRGREPEPDASTARETHGVRRNKSGAWIWADGPNKGRFVPKDDPAYPAEESPDGTEKETATTA